MKRFVLLNIFFFSVLSLFAQKNADSYYPTNNAENVNPDVQLQITFSDKPIIGTSGKIKIYNAQTDELVDILDLSIPPGPLNTRTPAPYDSLVYKSIPNKLYTVYDPDTTATHIYQKKNIGGNTEADTYHFYPVLIHENTASIHLHKSLDYNKTYYVLIDAEAISVKDGSFNGITQKTNWIFSTKKTPPSRDSKTLVVTTNGTGDFDTVQSAIDFIPDTNLVHKTIYIKNGTYNEIVYFRNKENVTFLGEDREKTIISYANNGVFNNRPMSPDPALAGGYHNLRAVFAMNNSNNIQLVNFTLRSIGEKPAQAEALLIKGEKNIVSHVNIEGSGDALQATGTIYITDSKIQGYGDNVLGYGAVFFNNCDFVSTFGPHLWVRNTLENHGNVLLNCTLRTIGDVETTIARAPDSGGKTYPYVEAVLINCKLEGIRPEGWGKVANITKDIKYWEYNSTNLDDGQLVDFSKRHTVAKKLTLESDASVINYYMNPSNILKGWSPLLAPIITIQPDSASAKKGETVELNTQVIAIPEENYQWFKNGKAIKNATTKTLKIKAKDKGEYHVEATNNYGKTTSNKVNLNH